MNGFTGFLAMSGIAFWLYFAIIVIKGTPKRQKKEKKKNIDVFENIDWCDICANETRQIFHNGGWRICKGCGGRFSEKTKQWEQLRENDGY